MKKGVKIALIIVVILAIVLAIVLVAPLLILQGFVESLDSAYEEECAEINSKINAVELSSLVPHDGGSVWLDFNLSGTRALDFEFIFFTPEGNVSYEKKDWYKRPDFEEVTAFSISDDSIKNATGGIVKPVILVGDKGIICSEGVEFTIDKNSEELTG